ncbi:hypothetical protein [Deinococcus geothermalis]|uniref:hypothetical protein n=1 Tax=Deinococcus geothermalis TaxID=68909 RepID=UPI00235325C0|nr:hypothetical protein [Deinococcus geothermalis]
MPAGPYPTKAMHEALKGRVTALETVTPPPGASSGPQRLSDQVAAGVTASGPRTETTEYITSIRLFRDAAGFETTFDAFRMTPFGWNAVTIKVDGVVVYEGSDQGFAAVDYSNPAYARYSLGRSFTGDAIEFVFDTGGSLLRLYDKATEVSREGFAQEVWAGENLVAQSATIELLQGATVVGPLAPDAMNVVAAPSALRQREFEIVDDGGTPLLRYRSSNGGVYNLPMTPESA